MNNEFNINEEWVSEINDVDYKNRQLFIETVKELIMDPETMYYKRESDIDESCEMEIGVLYNIITKLLLVQSGEQLYKRLYNIYRKIEVGFKNFCDTHISFYLLKNLSLQDLLLVDPHVHGIIFIGDKVSKKINVIVVRRRMHSDTDESKRILFMSCKQCILSLFTNNEVYIGVGQLYGDFGIGMDIEEGGLCYLTATNAILNFLGCESLTRNERMAIVYARLYSRIEKIKRIQILPGDSEEQREEKLKEKSLLPKLMDYLSKFDSNDGYKGIIIKDDESFHEYLNHDMMLIGPLRREERDIFIGDRLMIKRGTEGGSRLYRGNILKNSNMGFYKYHRYFKEDSDLNSDIGSKNIIGRFKLKLYCLLYPKGNEKSSQGNTLINYKYLFSLYPELRDKVFVLYVRAHVVFHNPLLHNMIDMNWDLTGNAQYDYDILEDDILTHYMIKYNLKDDVPENEKNRVATDFAENFGCIIIYVYECVKPDKKISENYKYGYKDPLSNIKENCEGHECYNKEVYKKNMIERDLRGYFDFFMNSGIRDWFKRDSYDRHFSRNKKMYDFVKNIRDRKPGKRIEKVNKDFFDEIRSKKGSFINDKINVIYSKKHY